MSVHQYVKHVLDFSCSQKASAWSLMMRSGSYSPKKSLFYPQLSKAPLPVGWLLEKSQQKHLPCSKCPLQAKKKIPSENLSPLVSIPNSLLNLTSPLSPKYLPKSAPKHPHPWEFLHSSCLARESPIPNLNEYSLKLPKTSSPPVWLSATPHNNDFFLFQAKEFPPKISLWKTLFQPSSICSPATTTSSHVSTTTSIHAWLIRKPAPTPKKSNVQLAPG